jgi:DNA-binding SARP family transcriptional activator
MPEPPLTVRVFGPLEVRLQGEPLSRLRTRKVAWTLALLVLRHDRALERDWLAGTLWPDSAADQASYNLRRCLSELRRALGPEAWRIAAPPRRPAALDLSGAEVDLVSFDEAIGRADAESLARAVALYGGPLLEGCTEEWVLPEREAREQAYLGALERLASERLSGGDAASAVTHLRRAVTVDPLREGAQRMLLEALAAGGEYGEAVQSYRALRLLLWEELRTEPAPETRAVYERIRAQAREEAARDVSPARRESAHRRAPAEAVPPIWNIPHRRNPNFTGREELLAGIEATLAADGHAALTQAIVGLGGIGKTQCALEYAYRHAGEYEAIWWVRSEEPTLLVADYAALAGPLDLPGKAALNQLATVAAVRHWLERSRGWLLILDNVPAPPAVADYLPRAGHGHVLITSRDQNWGQAAGAVTVPVLPQEEAVAFLQRRTGWSGPEVEVLAEELGQLPLALEHAAAYAAATGCSVTTYLDLFRTRRRALLQRAEPPEGYQGTVTSTWSLSMAQAAAECPAATGLLKLCACLAPDHIPLSLVQEGAEYLPEPLAEAARDPLLLRDAVAALRHYSLVSVHEEALSVHRLVQAVVRDGLGEAEQRQWAAAAVRVVPLGLPSGVGEIYSLGSWRAPALRLPHALAAADLALPLATSGFVTEISWLLSWAGRYLEILTRYDQARACFARAIACTERALGPEHPELIWLLYHLSDFSEHPRPLRERALAIAQREQDANVPILLIGVARALCYQGDDAGAAARCRQAVAMVEQTPPSDPWGVFPGSVRLRLAYLLTRLEDFSGALREAERGAAELEERLPPEAQGRGWGPVVLAYVLAHTGDHDSERREWARALAMWERIFTPGHPRLALAWFPLGLHGRLSCGDHVGARNYLAQTHDSFRQSHGPDTWLTCAALAGLAQVTQLTGDPAAAKPMAEHILAIAEKDESRTGRGVRLGVQGWEFGDFLLPTLLGLRLSVRGALNQLASVLLDLGELDAAQAHLERALTIEEVIYSEWSGPDYEGVAEVLPNLGRLRRLQGRLEESNACLEQSLATPERPGPPHQWRMAATHLEYGLTLQAMGDLAGAREHLGQAVSTFAFRLGPQHPRTEQARSALAALDSESVTPKRRGASRSSRAR